MQPATAGSGLAGSKTTRLGRAQAASLDPTGDQADAGGRPGESITPGASPAQSPDTGPWASQFAQILTEALAGSRPPSQIVPWTTEQTRRRINQLGPLLASAQRPRVRRVIVTSPASGVLEMTIVAGFGPRVRALAVRLERTQALEPDHAQQPSQPPQAAQWPANRARRPDRWRCTAVEAA